ncbi:MAG: hypothetical protein ACU843_09595 [Gammaproteobacteria bacterium]
MNRRVPLWLFIASLPGFFTVQAQAVTLGFTNVTGNNAVDAGTARQYSVEVHNAGRSQVSFLFKNTGPLASSITDVYFDDNVLSAIAGIDNSPGVDFSGRGARDFLPGYNQLNPPFKAAARLTAASNPPARQNGVNPMEALTIRYDLQTGRSFADVIDALSSGEMRIGIQVRDFAGGGSESFVNDPAPVPAALWFFGSTLTALGIVMRRKGNKKNDPDRAV